jgi:hypothetical protein
MTLFRVTGTKKAAPKTGAAFLNKILAVSYSHMGRPHTTIGAERFHFRVRNGIGWFPLAERLAVVAPIVRIADQVEPIFQPFPIRYSPSRFISQSPEGIFSPSHSM